MKSHTPNDYCLHFFFPRWLLRSMMILFFMISFIGALLVWEDLRGGITHYFKIPHTQRGYMHFQQLIVYFALMFLSGLFLARTLWLARGKSEGVIEAGRIWQWSYCGIFLCLGLYALVTLAANYYWILKERSHFLKICKHAFYLTHFGLIPGLISLVMLSKMFAWRGEKVSISLRKRKGRVELDVPLPTWATRGLAILLIAGSVCCLITLWDFFVVRGLTQPAYDQGGVIIQVLQIFGTLPILLALAILLHEAWRTFDYDTQKFRRDYTVFACVYSGVVLILCTALWVVVALLGLLYLAALWESPSFVGLPYSLPLLLIPTLFAIAMSWHLARAWGICERPGCGS